MPMIRKTAAVVLTAMTALPAAHADSIWGEFDTLDTDSVPLTGEPTDTFAGRVQLGYLAASGNSETENFNGKLLLGWDREKWRHAVVAAGIYSKDEDGVVAENYRSGYKADRKLDELNYLFATLSWEQDEFSGYDQRTTEAIGYGRRMFDTGRQHLDLEIGIGARQSEFTAPILTGPEAGALEQDETIGRLAADYFWKFGENSDFSQQIAVEGSSFNTYLESITSLTSQLVGELDLVISYTVKRNSTVPEDREKMDTYTSVSVQYNF